MNTPLDKVEAKLKAEESKVMAFVKANWAHAVTWAALAYQILKTL